MSTITHAGVRDFEDEDRYFKHRVVGAEMTVRFWGVRGSVPSPGASTVRYGGNTTCASIDLDPCNTLVLDAGTGIRSLGSAERQGPHHFHVLITHPHWDHIQGFPFFGPKSDPETRITFLLPDVSGWEEILKTQLDGIRFPVDWEDLPARISILQTDIQSHLEQYGVQVSRTRCNHPGTCFGYRIAFQGHSVAFLPDNELGGPTANGPGRDAICEFVRDVDLLIHDAQYDETEIAARRGWGHSLYSDVCDLAVDARVGHLVLFHHDPDRSDDQLDLLLQRARSRVHSLHGSFNVDAACEGEDVSVVR